MHALVTVACVLATMNAGFVVAVYTSPLLLHYRFTRLERLLLGLRWWRYLAFIQLARRVDACSRTDEEFWQALRAIAIAKQVRRFMS
ncbi:MAG: hypothetical protein ACRD68_19135 [Pyrinomonadaceae bacterium]